MIDPKFIKNLFTLMQDSGFCIYRNRELPVDFCPYVLHIITGVIHRKIEGYDYIIFGHHDSDIEAGIDYFGELILKGKVPHGY